MIALATTLRDLAADPEPTCRRLGAVTAERAAEPIGPLFQRPAP